MRVSKFRVVGIGFLLVAVVGSLAVSADQEKPRSDVFLIKCASTVDVVGGTDGVSPIDVYACPNAPITWRKADTVKTFFVIFRHRECPFRDPGSCRLINQEYPTSSSNVQDYSMLKVFDYEIFVDGVLYDPHVVGGGKASP